MLYIVTLYYQKIQFMFVKAIETAAQYTRAIHTISKSFSSDKIIPGAATLFFVNEQGYAVTCKHVAKMLADSEKINKNYQAFKAERDQLPKDGSFKKKLKVLRQKYNVADKSTVHLKYTFVNCVDTISTMTWHLHPDYDLAILKFNGFNKLYCNRFPVFKKDSDDIRQGKFLCRLGFPFPEFKNFEYHEKSDEIVWNQNGMRESPRFPSEGMITRFLGGKKGDKYGIELSTPGLRGQSGGPLFDSEGRVYGMQSLTKHLHLGFDIEDVEILAKGQLKQVSDYSFIHLGHCIHVDVIKDFLRQHNVEFNEQ